VNQEYWKLRCLAVERRMDQLEAEIARLKGMKPLTKEFIEDHNNKIRIVGKNETKNLFNDPLGKSGET
jgi:hypothetical protein